MAARFPAPECHHYPYHHHHLAPEGGGSSFAIIITWAERSGSWWLLLKLHVYSFRIFVGYFVLLLIIIMMSTTTTTEGMRTVLSGNRLPDIVPGRPGEDYPALSSIPVTQFRCTDQIHSGYFADLETSCQVIIKHYSFSLFFFYEL